MIALTLFLRKLWSWIKNYWYIPVILIGIVLLTVVLRKPPESLSKILSKAIDSHKKEVDLIEKAHQQEIEKRNKALNTYQSRMKAIEEEFKKKNIDLDAKQKKEIEKIVKKNKENPEELAREIAEKYGFTLVTNGDK